MLMGFILLGLGLVFYLIPTWVALGRGSRLSLAVFVANMFFGWTIIGWAVCLCVACIPNAEYQTIARGDKDGGGFGNGEAPKMDDPDGDDFKKAVMEKDRMRGFFENLN